MLQTGEITRLLRFVEINNWRTVQQTFIFLVKSVNLFSFIAEIVVAGECIIYCCWTFVTWITMWLNMISLKHCHCLATVSGRSCQPDITDSHDNSALQRTARQINASLLCCIMCNFVQQNISYRNDGLLLRILKMPVITAWTFLITKQNVFNRAGMKTGNESNSLNSTCITGVRIRRQAVQDLFSTGTSRTFQDPLSSICNTLSIPWS